MVQPTVLGDPHGYPHIYAGQYAASPYSTTPAAQSLYNGQMPYPTSTPTVVSSKADNPYSGSSPTAQGGMMPGVTAHSQPQQNGIPARGPRPCVCLPLQQGVVGQVLSAYDRNDYHKTRKVGLVLLFNTQFRRVANLMENSVS